MAKRWINVWKWVCNWSDPHHGCFHADYEGRCSAKSRKGFSTEEEARTAALNHESNCRHFKRTKVLKKESIMKPKYEAIQIARQIANEKLRI